MNLLPLSRSTSPSNCDAPPALCRTSRLNGLLVLLLACGPLGCSQTPPAEETAPPAPVDAVAPRALFLGQWTELTGTTQPLPQHAARVSAGVEGRVMSLLHGGDGKPLSEGQVVRAGDVIALLDDRVARANRDRTEAGQKDLDEQKKQAEYAVQLADIEVKKLEDLRTRGNPATGVDSRVPLVTPVEMEKARLTLDVARSQLRAVAARQDTAVKELKALDEQLAQYTLRAPITGRLGLLQVMPGQTLSIGAPVAEVIDLSQVDVLCYVPPHTAAMLALDQPVRLLADRDEGQEAATPTGKVVFLAVQAQQETGNFAVKVRFPNPNLQVRANTVVRVEVMTSPEKERLTIPESALMEDQEPAAVIVIDKPETKKNKDGKDEKTGTAHKLQAKVGIRDRHWHVVELLSLVDPEKKASLPLTEVLVITKGGHGLRDDDPVRIQEEEEEEK